MQKRAQIREKTTSGDYYVYYFQISKGLDRELNTLDPPKSEHVRILSPHCIYMIPFFSDWNTHGSRIRMAGRLKMRLPKFFKTELVPSKNKTVTYLGDSRTDKEMFHEMLPAGLLAVQVYTPMSMALTSRMMKLLTIVRRS